MKNIFFDDRFGHTDFVLSGRKTMKRVLLDIPFVRYDEIRDVKPIDGKGRFCAVLYGRKSGVFEHKVRAYHTVGETIAVGQSYRDAGIPSDTIMEGKAVRQGENNAEWRDSWYGQDGEWYIDQLRGWLDKTLTKPDIMPNRVVMINVSCERIQGITEDDCIKEGLRFEDGLWRYGSGENDFYMPKYASEEKSPITAFHKMIDEAYGEGTWDRNPYAIAYEFELEKERISD